MRPRASSSAAAMAFFMVRLHCHTCGNEYFSCGWYCHLPQLSSSLQTMLIADACSRSCAKVTRSTGKERTKDTMRPARSGALTCTLEPLHGRAMRQVKVCVAYKPFVACLHIMSTCCTTLKGSKAHHSGPTAAFLWR